MQLLEKTDASLVEQVFTTKNVTTTMKRSPPGEHFYPLGDPG